MNRTSALLAALATMVALTACSGGSPAGADPRATTSSSPAESIATTTARPTPSPSTTVPPSTTATSAPATTRPTEPESTGPVAVPPADAAVFAIVNATVVSATGAEPIGDGVVVVRDGVIAAVGTSADIEIPPDAELLDVPGGYVLPGLIDTHTHNLDKLVLDGGEFAGLGAGIYLESPVRSGLTAYRDAGSQYGLTGSLADLRRAIAEHDGPSPTVIVAGPILARSGSVVAVEFPGQVSVVDGADNAAATTVELIDQGVDQIKILIDEEFRGTESLSLSAAEIAAITEAAHARDVRVFAHVSDSDEAFLALDNGVDELTHWPGEERLSDELIEAIVESGTPVGATFSVVTPYPGDVRRLIDAGGTIVLSSDAPGAASSVATWRELERMVGAGMTPIEAIIAATRDAAVVVGLGETRGTLETGKAADILVVGGDPTAEITALADVWVVVKDGVIVTG